MLTYPAVAHSSNSESLIKRGQGCLPLTQTYLPTNIKACRHLLCDRSTFSSHRKCSFLAQATQSQQVETQPELELERREMLQDYKLLIKMYNFFPLSVEQTPARNLKVLEEMSSMRRDDDTITCDNSPAILKPRATSYRSMPCTRANRSSAMLNYQNHLRSKYRSNCKFHFHDVKPSARLTDLEIMLFHKQVISYPPGKLTECFKCILSPFRHALFLQGAVNSVRLQQ